MQPYLHDAVVALAAPTHAWSRETGDMNAEVDGLYHGDRRFVSNLLLGGEGTAPTSIGMAQSGPSSLTFDAIWRDFDENSHDPVVRTTRRRTVAPGTATETITVQSSRTLDTRLTLHVTPDFRPMQDVRSGFGGSRQWFAALDGDTARIVAEGAELTLSATGAVWRRIGDDLLATIPVHVEREDPASFTFAAVMRDATMVVRAADPVPWEVPEGVTDLRLEAWLGIAIPDLAALRLTLPDHPEDAFLAAGAPWYLTLFGRDSIWSARLMLPIDRGIAASTLRVLARLQGVSDHRPTEEEPGKMLHELRSEALRLPDEDVMLPPLYYGTVDATPLWVSLLAETAEAGMPETDVRALVPNLREAMGWIIRGTEACGGFLAYMDRSGHGLSNQGWKDSGDAIQWRDGTMAQGPIALCEVQGYCYEAAMGAADLLDRLGEAGGSDLRAWAAALRARFAERFWVETPEGRYPAVALDRDGRAVDTLTSNIGHLLGTGILDAAAEAEIARLLLGPSMSSGFGIRTLSTDAAGYWPLSYHIGSVWPHDTAIIARGMLRAGLHEEACEVADGMLRAARAFGYRIPELYAGDSVDERPAPAPYPTACRPQAWSSAAAVTCWEVLRA